MCVCRHLKCECVCRTSMCVLEASPWEADKTFSVKCCSVPSLAYMNCLVCLQVVCTCSCGYKSISVFVCGCNIGGGVGVMKAHWVVIIFSSLPVKLSSLSFPSHAWRQAFLSYKTTHTRSHTFFTSLCPTLFDECRSPINHLFCPVPLLLQM